MMIHQDVESKVKAKGVILDVEAKGAMPEVEPKGAIPEVKAEVVGLGLEIFGISFDKEI